MPCMLTMVLVVLGFTLSPETCEKVGLQISVSLAICIFLTIMNEMTPHTSEAVPLLGVFFQSCMVISVLATSFTVFVQSYHFRSHHNTLRMAFWVSGVSMIQSGLTAKISYRENVELWEKLLTSEGPPATVRMPYPASC
ncbi:hypothetical protein COOONC_26857 [Cooperia oncophora]